jgi:glycosyltransferase involved in cell wall biosynthesis
VPRLSVLLPCRDAAAHLQECIQSLETQTYRDYEVIAVDDGSGDATTDMLEAWSKRDSRVRVLRTEPRGLVPALQTALDTANGEVIARMDADDVAYPERFARQIALLARPLAACGTRVRYFPRNLVRDGALRYERWVNSLIEPDEIARDMFVECPVPHPTLMVTRSALEAVGGYRDAGWAEDYDLLLRLWSRGMTVGKVAEVLLGWREGSGRLSRTDPRYDSTSFLRCKIHFLETTLLRERPDVVVCGAGPVGKTFARGLAAKGFRIRAFLELDPRKIGQEIHGAPVIAYTSLGPPDGAFTLAAVSGGEARRQIRSALRAAGHVEMRDYCAVA